VTSVTKFGATYAPQPNSQVCAPSAKTAMVQEARSLVTCYPLPVTLGWGMIGVSKVMPHTRDTQPEGHTEVATNGRVDKQGGWGII